MSYEETLIQRANMLGYIGTKEEIIGRLLFFMTKKEYMLENQDMK